MSEADQMRAHSTTSRGVSGSGHRKEAKAAGLANPCMLFGKALEFAVTNHTTSPENLFGAALLFPLKCCFPCA